MHRIAILAALGSTAALSITPSASAGASCKTPRIKAGAFCVKQSTYDGTGNAAVIVPIRTPGKPIVKGVRIGLREQVQETCTDGTSTMLSGYYGLASPLAPLKGAKFSIKAVSGGTTREIRGRYTASNKVLIELYRQSYTSASGATCTSEAKNVSFKGK